VNFRHGQSKIPNDPESSPSYKFYNPSFSARQFGLGQLPPSLFFVNKLKPREILNNSLEAWKVFDLGSSFSTYHLHQWVKVKDTHLSLMDDGMNGRHICSAKLLIHYARN